jgi:hypothetical protein
VKVLFVELLVLLAFSAGAASASQQPQEESTAPSTALQEPNYVAPVRADESRIVYVSDFDLELPTGRDTKNLPSPVAQSPASQPDTKPDAKTEAKPDPKAESKPELKKEETAAERAARFTEFVSTALISELEHAGYVARRLRPGETRPEDGIRISGVFAEPDEQNRLRRAVIGGGPTVGQMALFVSIGNLARPDQTLYAIVDPKTAGNNVGPVITVSAYAPVARFEMSKNVTEKAVRDAATSIVTNLTLLLRTNVASLTH